MVARADPLMNAEGRCRYWLQRAGGAFGVWNSLCPDGDGSYDCKHKAKLIELYY